MGPTGQIVITFSKSMNPSTLTPTTAGYYNNIALLVECQRHDVQLPRACRSDNRTVTSSGLHHGIVDRDHGGCVERGAGPLRGTRWRHSS